MKTTPQAKKTTTEWVKLASIVYDPTVNTRPTDPRHVEEIRSNLDLDALGYPEVSIRPDGSIVVLDGMHRISALRASGWLNGQMVECKVHRGLSHERECELFDILNTQKPKSAIARMLARIGAHKSPEYEINEIVTSLGLRIGAQKADGIVCAPDALRRIYLGGRDTKGEPKPELLVSTLQLLLAAWGPNRHAFRSDILLGVGLFIARHGNEIETGALVERLTQLPGGPLKIVADGRSLSNLHNSQLSGGIAAKVTFIYNERRRSRKLPDWWAS